MTKAKDLIARVVAEAGIQHVFGLPGGGTLEIFDGLYDHRDRVTSILVRHEHGASIMADAYARASGRPALVMGQGAFIGSNAAFGIMEAFVSNSPMVIVTDTSDGLMPQHPANQSVTGDYGSPDILAMFRAMTKYTTLAATGKEAVIGTQLAIKHATSGRPGPAAVVFRSQAVLDDVDEDRPPYIHPTAGYLTGSRAVATPDDVARAAELLVNAEHPRHRRRQRRPPRRRPRRPAPPRRAPRRRRRHHLQGQERHRRDPPPRRRHGRRLRPGGRQRRRRRRRRRPRRRRQAHPPRHRARAARRLRLHSPEDPPGRHRPPQRRLDLPRRARPHRRRPRRPHPDRRSLPRAPSSKTPSTPKPAPRPSPRSSSNAPTTSTTPSTSTPRRPRPNASSASSKKP